MKENKLIKILIPVIALVVVFESITLVSTLNKETTKPNSLTGESNQDNQVVQQKVETEPVADFVWESETTGMKVGKEYKVILNLLPKNDFLMDSVETHIYFDPKKVTVSKLETNKDLGESLKPSGIDNTKGFITAILWKNVDEPGYEAKKSEATEVLSFMVTPKAEGEIQFDLSASKSDTKLATIIVDSNTARPLAYSSNILEINVSK